ncbi:RimJ/RimL family protein N-acetyltransferase [Paenibacillus phyllosphaerae]|uniref:RimJ/RimL family protein N-acetyltransferase n=1 Tax=Paenibacillus phyllosphaerae TaxID=274593 RepID=A0A7W5B1J6_9BACL|nr:GNAT family protein [Paenibacillus phyllosphaerae]MBB3112755.1 RimJ/RimL family protein N-acetyltransferase [Paenibacillus phyllosphaerae]
MHIRVLNEDDAAAYRALRLEALTVSPEAFGSTYEREAAFAIETFAERVKPAEGKIALGGFNVQGELSGIVTLVRENGPKALHKANIYGMYVAPSTRGTGLGKSLLTELIHRARQFEGLERINLTVVVGNEAAKRLYMSLGFEVYGLERHALKVNDAYYDEELMVLRL